MGQTSSTLDPQNEKDLEYIELSKEQVLELFKGKCKLLLRPVEVKAIASKTNITKLNEKYILTPSDLGYLFHLTEKNKDISSLNPKFANVCQTIYQSLKVLGATPFFRDFENTTPLTVDDLIVASIVHTTRYKRFIKDEYDHHKLLFISLTSVCLSEYIKFDGNKQPTSLKVAVRKPIHENDDLLPRISWKNFDGFKTYNDIDISELHITGDVLHQLLTLFLLILSIPPSTKIKMQETLNKLLAEFWGEFEESALGVLKFMDISISASNLSERKFKYDEFFNNENNVVFEIITSGFLLLFERGFLSSNFEDIENIQDTKVKDFTESKLMNHASIASISNALKRAGSEIQITTENLMKLYIGKEAGFSMRSLESKILKWQAPSILIVSGKRLRNKTVTTNKRYLQFDSEYPRFFRSSESPLKDWQHDNDRLTYAVLVTQPWRLSNKKNFGDYGTIICSLSPHFDYFKTSANPILRGESIYLNTLGMGIGFGNDQPINKNATKKFLPGDISLTIEANLEFAVFRHINSGNVNNYFNRSNQFQLKNQDYEDRFIITDLEVWGVGSTKELDNQKKQWEWEQKQAEARQSVNLKNLGEERAFLEMVGLVGNHGSGGSI